MNANGSSLSPDGFAVLLVIYKIRADTGSEDGSGYNIAAELVRRGCRITIISREDNVEFLRHDPIFASATLVGLDVPRALSFYKRRARGIIAYYYTWQILVGRLVHRLLARESFDIVHQLNFHTDWAPHFLAGGNVPVVWGPIAHHPVTPRGFFPRAHIGGYARELSRAAIKRAFWYFDPALRRAAKRTDRVLYGNPDFAPPFRRLARSPRVRPYAGSFATGWPSAPAAPTVFRALWIGRFVAMKGPLIALRAFDRFVAIRGPEHSAVELLLVGRGPLEDQVRALAASPRLRGRVHIEAWAPQVELEKIYRSAAVFLYPSVEAQGLVVAEALSFGIPMLTIAGTGPATLAGDSGWTIPPHHPVQALAGRLVQAHDEWQRDGLAARRAAALARYRDHLDWSRIADDILDVYREVSRAAAS